MNRFYILADEVNKNLGERTVEALEDTLIGMLVVFLALSVLWAVIEIFHAVVSRATGKKNTTADPSEAESAPETIVSAETPTDDDAAIVAAITAAISACIDAPVGSFRVVSFKRSAGNAHWNKN